MAMAAEILRYRHAVAQISDAVSWMREGAPFSIIGPGPYWTPKPVPVLDDGEAQ
jgi:hypothetical protein